MPSKLAKKAAGTYVADETYEKSNLLRWLQSECRNGRLAEAVRLFASNQLEPLDPSLVQVEKLQNNEIVCFIPCRLFDHENPTPFNSRVWFTLDPLTEKTSNFVEI